MRGCINCLAIIVLIVTLSIGSFLFYYYKGCNYTIDQVVKKEELPFASGTKYRVVGNNDTYEIASDLALQQMPDKDLYERLVEKTNYKFRTCGFRIPLINFYKVIVNYEEIK